MATYLDIENLPRNVIAGFQHAFRVTARNVNGSVDAAYAGTVAFTSNDVLAQLPAAYTFQVSDSGTRLFKAKFATLGSKFLRASDGATSPSTGRMLVQVRPPGWGLDDFSLLPYGDAASGIGAFLKSARAVSTREVEVEVSNLVQDNSSFLVGDALNPSTWQVQRLDTADFFHVVGVTQTGTYKYTLLCLEEFGAVGVTHRVSSTTLKDVAGAPINSPKNADFLGITDEDASSVVAQLAQQKTRTQDIANSQVPVEALGFFAGTLQLSAAGDYQLESGNDLSKKLVLRRFMTKPREFFHLPDTYGLGLRDKEPVPSSDLGKLKSAVEAQATQERDVKSAAAALELSSNGVLTVKVRITPASGDAFEVGFKSNSQGLVL